MEVILKKYVKICFISGIMLMSLAGTSLAAKNLKPRVLVIPFDNMMADKNYDWMQGSISDNLKEQLVKTNRFEVMDATLLRQINPDLKFQDLTENEATPLARKLNCEAVIIGRYIIKKKEEGLNALIQIEAVNAVSNESIVIKSEYSNLDSTIFTQIEKFAGFITSEFIKKLPPVRSEKNTRSSDLEKIIYRLQHPPKGFFDTLVFSTPDSTDKEKQQIILEPAFDIDTFEYDLNLPLGIEKLSYLYTIWGKTFAPHITMNSEPCKKNECSLTSDEAEMIISRNRTGAASADKKNNVSAEMPEAYKIRIHRQTPMQPVAGRLWINGGYPYMKSFSFISPGGNPAAMTAGGKFPFDLMSGVVSAEIGFSPAWLQFGAGIRWSLAAQFQYTKGDVPLKTADSGLIAAINMFSMGGGIRIDRPFHIGKIYGISPMIGFYTHYQIFNNTDSGASFHLMGLNPEIGLIQSFRLGAASHWKITITTVFGSYLYQDQNLSYIRANAGVEYAIK